MHARHPHLQDEEESAPLTQGVYITKLARQFREIEKPMLRKNREVFVYNKTKETFLAFRVSVADSILARLIGLLGKRSLKPDSGVWIVPSNSIHTIGMLFAFDVVMIDKDFKVVGVRELLRPFRIVWPNLRAESTIELPPHAIFRSRTEIGDQLVIERYEPKKLPDADPAQMRTVEHTHESVVARGVRVS